MTNVLRPKHSIGDADSAQSRFQGSLYIKEIEVSNRVCPVLVELSAGNDHRQNFLLRRQRIFLCLSSKHLSDLEKLHIAAVMIEVQPNRVQKTRKDGRTHTYSPFDDGILQGHKFIFRIRIKKPRN